MIIGYLGMLSKAVVSSSSPPPSQNHFQLQEKRTISNLKYSQKSLSSVTSLKSPILAQLSRCRAHGHSLLQALLSSVGEEFTVLRMLFHWNKSLLRLEVRTSAIEEKKKTGVYLISSDLCLET